MENNLMPFESEAEKSREIVDGINSSIDLAYVSFTPDTMEEKVRLYNAMSDQGERVKDYVNKLIDVVDVVIVPVNLEGDIVPRCVLILEDGRTVAATSWGVYRSLQKLNTLFDGLHFEEPLKIMPVEVKTKKGQTINLRII